jgi:Family of unknown function (DUF6364)
MDTKLTLKLDQMIIEQAKNYAKDRNTSLSKLIESYLGKLVEPDKQVEITPLVQSLSGIIAPANSGNHKKAYRKHLLTKYGK